MRPTRPPPGFVLVTPARWGEFAHRLGAKPRAFQLKYAGGVVGWRNSAARFVDPHAYKATLDTWPDGFWPDVG